MKTYINFINESKQDYNELLLNSAKNNDLKGVKKALAKGANIDIQNNYGNTALIYASVMDYTEICKLLANKILETEPYRAYELRDYLTPEQKEKYKEFIVGQRDFDLFD